MTLLQADHKVESVLNFYQPLRSRLAWMGKSRNAGEAVEDVGAHETSSKHMSNPTYDQVMNGSQ